MKTRIQAKHIADEAILGALARARGKHGVPHWSTLWDTQAELPDVPKKVVLAKLKSLVKRKVIRGCVCGCRGDFELVDAPRWDTCETTPLTVESIERATEELLAR